MILSLRAGTRLYINGAVLQVDRKVNLQLLNDATFLLEAHVMLAADATTPLRQLYFAIQMALMEPAREKGSADAAHTMLTNLLAAFDNPDILAGLARVRGHIDAEGYLEALKAIRQMFAAEDAILAPQRESNAITAGEAHDSRSRNQFASRLGNRHCQQAGHGQL